MKNCSLESLGQNFPSSASRSEGAGKEEKVFLAHTMHAAVVMQANRYIAHSLQLLSAKMSDN